MYCSKPYRKFMVICHSLKQEENVLRWNIIEKTFVSLMLTRLLT